VGSHDLIDDEAAAHAHRLDELEALVGDRDRLAQLLSDAEQRLAGVPELERRIVELESQLADARATVDLARREVWELDRTRMYTRRLLRRVRPLIQLLRKVRRRIRG
jgi:hypothetical protein